MADGSDGYIFDPSNPPDFDSLDECSLDTCPLWTSFYNYRIDVVANAFFVGLFTIALLWFLIVWIRTRRNLWFTLAMMLGLMAEIAGYVARLFSWGNQWDINAFLAQIICITVGPAFFSAAIYLCLEDIVDVYGENISRIPKRWYTRIFIPGDVVSLLLQMIGGILAAVALLNDDDLDPGDDVIIAGLSTQVFSLFVFIIACIDFAARLRSQVKKLGPEVTMDSDPAKVQLRRSRTFKAFLAAQALATILIFWRSCYRVAELNEGWSGPITFNQPLFIGMEPVLIVIAVYALGIFHPAYCLQRKSRSNGAKSTKA